MSTNAAAVNYDLPLNKYCGQKELLLPSIDHRKTLAQQMLLGKFFSRLIWLDIVPCNFNSLMFIFDIYGIGCLDGFFRMRIMSTAIHPDDSIKHREFIQFIRG